MQLWAKLEIPHAFGPGFPSSDVIQNLRLIMICCVFKCSLVFPNDTGLVMVFGFVVVCLLLYSDYRMVYNYVCKIIFKITKNSIRLPILLDVNTNPYYIAVCFWISKYYNYTVECSFLSYAICLFFWQTLLESLSRSFVYRAYKIALCGYFC